MRRIMYRVTGFFLTSVLMLGCATIPSEAPRLSAELGEKIGRIEEAHLTLLHRFFDEKRNAVDQFIQKEWVPHFAAEFFSHPTIARAWQTIVSEKDEKARLDFIIKIGPKLQEKINAKRVELIAPLDELEDVVENQLRKEFTEAKAINNSITSFLLSAAKVEANRTRYIEKAGLSDEKLGQILSKTDDAVSGLLNVAADMPDRVKSAKKYIKTLQELRDKH